MRCRELIVFPGLTDIRKQMSATMAKLGRDLMTISSQNFRRFHCNRACIIANVYP